MNAPEIAANPVAQQLGRRLKGLLREPVVVFALVAGGFFAYDMLANASDTAEAAAQRADAGPPVSRTIVLSAQLRKALEEEFHWLEGRPPSAEERERLARNWLDGEILFREALAGNMHITDAKTRARLVDRIRLLWAGSPEAPEEQVLLDYYLNGIERYYTETKISFDQVFFENASAGNAASHEVLAALRAGQRVTGDVFWLGSRIELFAESILRGSFGGEFVAQLTAAATGEWIGPLASPRGQHFVRVEQVEEPAPMPYALIREQVLEDWLSEARNRRVAEQIAAMQANYQINVEPSDG